MSKRPPDDDEARSAPCTVTILDTISGQTVKDSAFSATWWVYGSGSCDCNRDRLFSDLPPAPWDAELRAGYCNGCRRFLIVACSDPYYSLLDLNNGYPEELLAKHGIA